MEHVTVKFPEIREMMIDGYSYDTLETAVKSKIAIRSLLSSSG